MIRAQLDHFRAPLVLGALGAGLLHAYVTGQVGTLLHPLLQPWVLAGAVGLLAAALLHLLLAPAPEFRPAPETAALAKRLGRDLLVVAALLGGLALAPRDFSSLALANRQGADPALLLPQAADAKPPEWKADASGAIPVETTDLALAAEHADTTAALEGHVVRLHGQLAPVPGQAGEFQVVRFLMFCCAADAQPVAARVKGEAPTAVRPMGWVEVSGPVHFVLGADGKMEPVLTLQAAQPIPAPADKFLY